MNSKILSSKLGFLKVCLLAFTIAIQTGCGGGDTTAKGPGDIIGTGVEGIAAIGAALANAEIIIKSETGAVKTGTTKTDGKFLIDDLADDGPYLLRANLGNGEYLYSVAHKGAGDVITRNIHPYTDLIIRNWFETQGLDINNVFAGTTPITNMPSEQSVNQIKNEIQAIVAQILENNDVADGFDLLSTPFDANSTGFDLFLDNTPVIINNNQITVIVNNPVTNIENLVINGVNLNTDFTSTVDTAPTTPQNVRALPVSNSEILVVWDASSDDKGVAGYNVYRNGSLVATTPYPVFSDTGLVGSTNYSYTVEAIDGRAQTSNLSTSSAPVTVDTPDTTAPPAPSSATATTSSNTINLSWTQSQIDDVAGFSIYRGAAGNATTLVANITTTTYNNFNLASATEFCYRVEAYDGAGNTSPLSNETCATTDGVISNPSNVALSSASFQVSETAGSITITVNRSGDISQAISVDYNVENGSALDGLDFNAITGTLNWAATDATAKTFSVQILSDSLTEGNETVQISLLNPSATNIGLSTATLTIADSGPVACTGTLADSNITTDTILDQPCYTLPDGIRVSNPAKLTVQPGVRLEFAAGEELRVEQGASLNAVGTIIAPIVFTSPDPTPGFWDGIIFYQSNSNLNRLEFVVVEYGQTNVTVQGFSFAPARLSLKDTTLRNASARGLSITDSSSSGATIIPEFQNITLTGNNVPIALPDNMVSILGTDSSYSGNTDDRIYVNEDTDIISNQTWQKLDVPYFMNSQTQYSVEAALTLQPGVQLIFNSGTSLRVTSAGSLNAVGTSVNPILFTGQNASPGYWDGVEYYQSNSTNNQLDFVTIEYGLDNLTLFGFVNGQTRVSIKNTQLLNASNHGFSFSGSAVGDITIDAFQNVTTSGNNIPGTLPDFLVGILGPDSSFTGNTDDRLHITEDGITADLTMQKLNVPYFMSDVAATYVIDAFLTIDPGVTLIFNSGIKLQINTNGALNAVGTASEPITFTGLQSVAAYWSGIHFDKTNSPNNVLDNTVVEYAGDGTQATAGNITMNCFSFDPTTLSITNSVIKDSGAWGIYRNNTNADGCNLSQSANTFNNNALGSINQ